MELPKTAIPNVIKRLQEQAAQRHAAYQQVVTRTYDKPVEPPKQTP